MNSLSDPFEATENERLAQIYTAAAELFCEKGFDGTSMSAVAEMVGITKAGIYHFIPGGKKDLLFAIMSYGLDRLDTHVITPAHAIPDAEERLRSIINNHVRLITSGSKTGGHNPVTIVVEEVGGLSPTHRRKIDQRKRVYVELIRDTLKQLKQDGKLQAVDETVAAFSLLGIILWISRWYDPDGRLSAEQVADEIMKLALGSLLRPQTQQAHH
ncbi:MAG: TetR family transcriptional regulator [Acidobacteria bacterium]|nr:TetR family transcriptional regulator [Acidobacteriota bacterium]